MGKGREGQVNCFLSGLLVLDLPQSVNNVTDHSLSLCEGKRPRVIYATLLKTTVFSLMEY